MRILLVEDDRNLSAVLTEQLQKEGYLTDCCYDGEMALSYASHSAFGYDVILLDRMLPVIDGLTVLKAIRAKGIMTPVLIITGLGDIADKIDGLDCGADDYLVKPFHTDELYARIRALTRRPTDLVQTETLSAFDLFLDVPARKLTCNGTSILLTQKETALLSVFLKQPAVIHSREQLLWKVWGGDTQVENGNIDNYIHFLRKRLRELN